MALTPTVAIVGRPNVGKSTLFNRLVGRRQAIVHGRPGVTRDRISAALTFDDERSATLFDTGGLVPGEDALGLNEQVLAAVEEADVLLLVVDGRAGRTPADETVWETLRDYGRPTVLVVNKSDVREAREGIGEFYRMGITPQVLVSAEHGTGIEELRDALIELLPALDSPPPTDEPRVAIVGRPNVGKSSLVNRITGTRRSVVAARPGTTRDPVDSVVERDGTSYRLVDTAGIRRRSRLAEAPDELAVLLARRQIEAADLCLLLVDAADGVTTGDLGIAGAIREMGRGAVVAVNKWDLLDEESRRDLEADWPRLDGLLGSPRRCNVSALTGRGVEKIFPALDACLEDTHRRLPTAELNELVRGLVGRHQPPSERGKSLNLLYATQVGEAPPSFLIFANRTLPRQSPYRRYLEKGMREALGLRGVPLRLVVRKR